jgi:hypothetical protein
MRKCGGQPPAQAEHAFPLDIWPFPGRKRRFDSLARLLGAAQFQHSFFQKCLLENARPEPDFK